MLTRFVFGPTISTDWSSQYSISPHVSQVFPVRCAKNAAKPSTEAAAKTPCCCFGDSRSNNGDGFFGTFNDTGIATLILILLDDLELQLTRLGLGIVREFHLKREEETFHTSDQVRDARFLKRTPMDLEPLATDFLDQTLLDPELQT